MRSILWGGGMTKKFHWKQKILGVLQMLLKVSWQVFNGKLGPVCKPAKVYKRG